MRGKLIELIMNSGCVSGFAGSLARHLIANGVTFATDNNVPCKWIPVSERLPEGADGKSFSQNVVAYLNNEMTQQVCPGWLNGDVWHLLANGFDYHTRWGLGAVTHWMPLPEPPKGESNENN